MNEEPRRGSDGRMYPRLRIRKITAIETAFPWRLEQLQAPGPFANRSLHYEGSDAMEAFEKAGQILDNAFALRATILSPRKPAPTPEEIHALVNRT